MYKYNKFISWFLIFLYFFMSIDWGSITVKADATDDLNLANINVDINHPYAIITVKIQDGVKNYNLYMSSSQIFYMNDYKKVITKDSTAEILKYSWNTTTKEWVVDEIIKNNYIKEMNINDFLKEEVIIKSPSDVTGNKLGDGYYLLAYGTVNENSYIKNHNYLDYGTLNKKDFIETDTTSLNLSLSMINKVNANIVFNPDTEGSLTPNFKTIYPGSSFILPKIYQFEDSKESLFTSTVSWDMSVYYVDDGYSKNIDDYFTFEADKNKYTIKNSVSNDAIIKIEATYKTGTVNQTRVFYAVINDKKEVYDYTGEFKNQINTLDKNELFVATNYFEGYTGTSLNAYSEEWTKYYLYSEIFNPFLKSNPLTYNDVKWEIIEATGFTDLKDINKYVKLVQGTSTERAYIEINADEITKLRRDNKNNKIFDSITLKASKDGYNDIIMNVDLNIEMYLGGKFLAENANIDIAIIELRVPVVGQYDSLPRNTKYVKDGKYITLINYSDYQLLFYTNNQPYLSKSSLALANNTNIEIYKNTNSTWEYFNYVSGLKNGAIELPTEGIKTIDFINYDLYTDTGTKVLDKNEIDVNNHIKLRNVRMPILPISSEDKYYILVKNNIGFYLVKTKNVLNIKDKKIDYSNAEFYLLVQNKWVKADDTAISINGLKEVNYLDTFEKYLKYTNDTTNFKDIPKVKEEGPVDYFRYLPNYNVNSGYNFIIYETAGGYASIEYKDATLVIRNGNIVFENKGSKFDIKGYKYSSNVWYEVEKFNENVNKSTGMLKLGGIVNSILYSDKNLLDGSGNLVFDTSYSSAVLVLGEFTYGDFLTTRPNPETAKIDSGVLDSGDKLSYYKYIYMEESYSTEEGSTYYYTATKYPLYYNSQVYGSANIYLNLEGKPDTKLLRYKFNNITKEWEYVGYTVYKPVNEDGDVNYIISYNDIVWHNEVFVDPERIDQGYILNPEEVIFMGETNLNYDEKTKVIDVSDLDTSEVDYVQPIKNPNSYWIAFVDNLSRIINPFENNYFGVVSEGNSLNLDLYVPLYTSSIVKILSGELSSGNTVFDLNKNSLIKKSDTDWYSPIPAATDNVKPNYKNIYIVNNTIKYSAEDLPEYQLAVEGIEIKYLEHEGKVYKRITADEYNANKPDIQTRNGYSYIYVEGYDIDKDKYVLYNGEKIIIGYNNDGEPIYQRTVENGIEVYIKIGDKTYHKASDDEISLLNDNFNKYYKIINGNYYLLRESYTIGEDGYVYNNEQKLIREVIEDGQTKLCYASGVDSYVIEVNEDVVFGYAFSFVDEKGHSASFTENQTVPVGTRIPLVATEFKKPLNGANLTFYVKDKQGNISDGITINLSKTDNNKLLYGESNPIIENEIEQAIKDATTDTVGPEILYMYIYNGELNVVAKDVAQEGVTPVGLASDSHYIISVRYIDFENREDLLLQDIEYKTQDNLIRKIESKNNYTLDDIVVGGFDGHGIKDQGIKLHIPKNYFNLIKDEKGKIQSGIIEVSVFDKNNNETYASQYVYVGEDNKNTIVYGTCNDSVVLKMLEKAIQEEDKDDTNAYPVIDNIYILNNVLYVTAHDDVGIASYGYGFEWLYNSTMPETTTGKTIKNDVEEDITIQAGASIPKGTLIYKNVGQQKISIPTIMNVYVKDTSGQITKKQVIITSSNEVLYGNVPDNIRDRIDRENGDNPIFEEGNSLPVFTAIYTYQGKLYIEGYDKEGLASYPYGFNPMEEMIINSTYEGYDVLGNKISIPTGRVVQTNTKIYKLNNFQEINIPMFFKVYLRDKAGQEVYKSLYIDKDNFLYYGKVPEDLDGKIDTPIDDDDGDNGNPQNPKDDDNSGGGDDNTGGNDGGNTGGNPGGNEDGGNTGDDGDNTGGDDSGDNKDDNDDEKGGNSPDDGNFAPGSGDNSSGTIKPDDDFKDIDWKKYDYLLEILDKNTRRVIYRIQKDKAETLELPRLEDSTEYIYIQSAVSEADNSVKKKIEASFIVSDKTVPVISKIWISDNRIYVNAYDKGGLHKQPYNFVIENARNQSSENFSSTNNKRIVAGDIVVITVRDNDGNKSSVKVEVKEIKNSVLYENLNPKDAIYIENGTIKTTSYWLAYFKSKYNIDTKNMEFSELNTTDKITMDNNNITFGFEGNGVLAFYNKETNKYTALTLRTSNAGKSYRTIIVEKGSQTDVIMAFKQKLIETFGTIDGLTWATDEKYISREGVFVNADIVGVSKVVVAKGNDKINLYVVVADKISKVSSNVDFKKENFAYTYLLNDKFNLSSALNSTSKDIQYVVIEDASDGITRKDDTITLTKIGKKSIILIDVVKDVMTEIKFEVVNIKPHISKFTDIISSDYRADIEYLTEKGVIAEYADNKFKPNNKMTVKEFLTMLNRIRLLYDKDIDIKKVKKEINLSSKDFDYYSSLNILINLSEDKMKQILKENTLNKAITFEETVNLISETILYNDYHNESGYKVPEGLSDASEAALHLLSIGILREDDNRNGSRELTRGEIAYLLTEVIKYFEY